MEEKKEKWVDGDEMEETEVEDEVGEMEDKNRARQRGREVGSALRAFHLISSF